MVSIGVGLVGDVDLHFSKVGLEGVFSVGLFFLGDEEWSGTLDLKR